VTSVPIRHLCPNTWVHLATLFKIAPARAALFRTGHHSAPMGSKLPAVHGVNAPAGIWPGRVIRRPAPNPVPGQRLLVPPSACVPGLWQSWAPHSPAPRRSLGVSCRRPSRVGTAPPRCRPLPGVQRSGAPQGGRPRTGECSITRAPSAGSKAAGTPENRSTEFSAFRSCVSELRSAETLYRQAAACGTVPPQPAFRPERPRAELTVAARTGTKPEADPWSGPPGYPYRRRPTCPASATHPRHRTHPARSARSGS